MNLFIILAEHYCPHSKFLIYKLYINETLTLIVKNSLLFHWNDLILSLGKTLISGSGQIWKNPPWVALKFRIFWTLSMINPKAKPCWSFICGLLVISAVSTCGVLHSIVTSFKTWQSYNQYFKSQWNHIKVTVWFF